MSETVVRHLIAFLGTLVVLLAFWVGYTSGQNGWWWAGVSVIVVYMALYSLIEA